MIDREEPRPRPGRCLAFYRPSRHFPHALLYGRDWKRDCFSAAGLCGPTIDPEKLDTKRMRGDEKPSPGSGRHRWLVSGSGQEPSQRRRDERPSPPAPLPGTGEGSPSALPPCPSPILSRATGKRGGLPEISRKEPQLPPPGGRRRADHAAGTASDCYRLCGLPRGLSIALQNPVLG